MTEIELRKYLPVMFIGNDVVVSKRGDITFGWRIYLPVSYTVNEAGYDSIVMSFLQSYKLLPPYCIVHKQDIFRNDVYRAEKVGEFLGDSYERFHDGRVYLNGYCYLYLTFSSRSAIETKTGSGMISRIFNPRIPDAAYVSRCASVASQFAAVLNNNPLICLEPLRKSDYLRCGEHGEDLGLMADYLNLYSLQPSLHYPLRNRADRVVVGDMEARCWYVEDSDAYPGMVNSVVPISSMSSGVSQVYLSGGSPIGYQLRIPHIVNRYVITLPVKVVENELDQKKRIMTSFSLYSASDRVNSGEIDDYLLSNAMNGETTVKCFTDVIAWGSERAMRDVRNAVVTAFSSLDVTCCEDEKASPSLFLAGFPGAASWLGYDFYMISEMVAFLCHGLWDGYDAGMEGGHLKLCDRRRMIPIPVDIQSVARSLGYTSNQNAIVVGPSGSGKSFTMNTLLRNFYDHGDHVLVIDIGDSYEGICRVFSEQTGGRDGVYNTYDPKRPYGFNPFKGRKKWNDVDADGDFTSSGYDFIMSLIETMYEPAGGWNKQLTGLLSSFLLDFFNLWDNGYDEFLRNDLLGAYINAARARAKVTGIVFDERNIELSWHDPLPEYFGEQRRSREPVFDDFYQYIRLIVNPLVNDGNYYHDGILVTKEMFDISSFAIALAKYSRNGAIGHLLNAETEEDLFASRFTVFEVDMIKDNEDMFPLWMLSVMHSFEDKMRTLAGEKVIVIEEAWSAIAKPSMARFITWMWRTARKFRTSAVVVTQSLSDLMASSIIKDAIVHNSDIKILLQNALNASNAREYADIMGLDDMSVDLALSVGRDLNPGYRYKEAFLAIGDHFSNVFGILVSPQEALVSESDKVKKKPLYELAERKGSFIEAVNEMAAGMTKGK